MGFFPNYFTPKPVIDNYNHVCYKKPIFSVPNWVLVSPAKKILTHDNNWLLSPLPPVAASVKRTKSLSKGKKAFLC